MAELKKLERQRAEQLSWDIAIELHTIEGYREYLATYPNGEYDNKAKNAIRGLSADDHKADQMVFVKGGTFLMGCPTNNGQKCDDDELPSHEVTVSDFYIGRYEITQAEWRNIMGTDPRDLEFKGCDDCPVENVTWNDVQVFIKKLNQKTGKNYRLPTEAEWEYAAKGGTNTNGKTALKRSNKDINSYAWYFSNSSKKTQPVGKKKPNRLGLYDMFGNVYEWCSDWYGRYDFGQQINPMGPAISSARVCRGGSWGDGANYVNAVNRGNSVPDEKSKYIGFRLVLPTE